MVGLSEEQKTKYVEMLSAADKKVDLDESGTQTVEKEEENKDEYKVDFNEMDAEEIEAIVEKYATDNGVPVEDARDIIYEKYSTKEEK